MSFIDSEDEESKKKTVSLSNLESFIKKTLGGAGEGLKIETLVNTILNKFYGTELYSDYAAGDKKEERWKVGTQVLVFSKSKDRWIRGFIKRQEDEGYVTVEYGNSMKTVHPDSDEIKLPGDSTSRKDSPKQSKEELTIDGPKTEEPGFSQRLKALESALPQMKEYREKQFSDLMKLLEENSDFDNKIRDDDQEEVNTPNSNNDGIVMDKSRIAFVRKNSDEIRNKIISSLFEKRNSRTNMLVRKGSVLRENLEGRSLLTEEEEKESNTNNTARLTIRPENKLHYVSEHLELSPKHTAESLSISANISARNIDEKVDDRKPQQRRDDNVIFGNTVTAQEEKEAWEVKVIHQWTHDDLLDFLKRNYRALLKVFEPTALTGRDIVGFKLPDLIKLGVSEGGVRNRLFQDIQRRKAETSVPNSPETNVPYHPIEAYQCSDVLAWLERIGLSEYASIFRRKTVNGKRLMNLKTHNLVKWGIRKKDDRKLILTSRNELFKIKKDKPANRHVSSIIASSYRSGGTAQMALPRSNPELSYKKSSNSLSEEKSWSNSAISPSEKKLDVQSQRKNNMIHQKGDIVLTKVLGASDEHWVQGTVEHLPVATAKQMTGSPSSSSRPPSSIFSPSPTKPKADLPDDPREWTASQVVKAISDRVGSRSAAVFRLEKMDGRALLQASPQKQAALVSNMSQSDRRKIKSFLMELKQKAERIDALSVSEAKSNYEPSLRLSLPQPLFWTPQHLSEWLEGLEGGMFSKYTSKVARMRITGEQLLSSQKNILSRIGIRDPRELKIVQSHILNFAATFKPLEIHPSEWTKEHVEEFFLTQGDDFIAKYTPQFIEAGLDGDLIMKLNGDQLRKMGVLNSGHQRKVLALLSSCWVQVGDLVNYLKLPVQVRYIGFPRLPSYRGEWIGIELKISDVRRLRRPEKSRVNDGIVKGIRYFTARRGCGLFVRRSEITAKRRRSR